MSEPNQSPVSILSLTPTTRRDRLAVHVGTDDQAMQSPGPGRGRAKAVATLSLKRVEELGLVPGQSWDEALAAKVERAAAFDRAMDDSTRRLNRRAMTRWMLDQKLSQLDHQPSIRRAVLDRLTEVGLLDDEAFGRALIREAQATRPAGPHLLRKKLRDKGLAPPLIDRLVHEHTPEPEDQHQAGLTLARKRLATMRGADKRTKLRRLQGLLARRGFESEISRDVLEALSNELDNDDDDDAYRQ